MSFEFLEETDSNLEKGVSILKNITNKLFTTNSKSGTIEMETITIPETFSSSLNKLMIIIHQNAKFLRTITETKFEQDVIDLILLKDLSSLLKFSSFAPSSFLSDHQAYFVYLIF